MKVAIIGRTQILYETALKLHEDGHQIACIITAKAAPEYSRTESDFEELARQLNAHFLLTSTLDKPEVAEYCQGLDIGISINWVSVVRQRHLDMFRLGVLNSHHGDLPKYRGNACSNWAIINNEEQITNSIHFMEGGRLDCGRIILQEHFKLGENSTITEVYRWTEESVPGLYAQALHLLEADNAYILKYADSDASESFRCYPRLPEDGFIHWEQGVLSIHNLIRAVCEPFSGAYTYQWEKGEVRKLIVLESRVVQLHTKDIAVAGHILENNPETGESLVQCGDGIIALRRCRYEDEPEDFAPGKRWRSIRMRLGVRVEDWLWQISRKGQPGL